MTVCSSLLTCHRPKPKLRCLLVVFVWLMGIANILSFSCSLGYLRRFTWINAVPKQGSFWQPSIVSHLELYHWLKQGLQTFLSEGHISFHATIREPDILRNVIVSWYVTFYQINNFFVDVGLLLIHYWQNGFAGRIGSEGRSLETSSSVM